MSAIAPKKTQRGSPRRISWIWWLLLSLMMLAAGLVFSPQQIDTRQWSRQDIWGIDRALIRRTLGLQIDQNRYPEKIAIEHEGSHHTATVEYTIDPGLQAAVAGVFEQYNPDYGVFAALDADTGEILALVNHQRRGITDQNLATRATYPAASVFKIVTAAAVLDLDKATPSTVIPFNGKTTSLYRKNVLNHKDTEWTRRYPLSTAFAKSVNTVFARLGTSQQGPGRFWIMPRLLGLTGRWMQTLPSPPVGWSWTKRIPGPLQRPRLAIPGGPHCRRSTALSSARWLPTAGSSSDLLSCGASSTTRA